jgi:tRNA(fMet)-specific endonuclease VapC
MTSSYMLDTNICSFIMRERPAAALNRLQAATNNQSTIVISVVTYYEILLGTIGRKASPHHAVLAEAFVSRLSAILPWDREAADQATRVHKDLAAKGTPIGGADTMIAGHALATDCVLVTNNVRQFARVRGLRIEDWAAP